MAGVDVAAGDGTAHHIAISRHAPPRSD
jgi:hypothetical protein